MSPGIMTFEPQSHRTTFTIRGVDPLPDIDLEFPLGYKNITDLYLGADPPRPEELSAALSVVELHLDDISRELGAERSLDDGRSRFDMTVRDGVVSGVGPLLVNVAAVEVGSADFELEGFVLTREAVEDVFRTIATESLADRAYNPGLDAEWTDLILGGGCLVVEMMRCWDIDSITLSAGAEI